MYIFLYLLIVIIGGNCFISADIKDSPLAISPSAIASCDPGDAMLYKLTSSDAFCIDGTKPVFYLRKGREDGVNKWMIYFEGGGWCFNLDDCAGRSRTRLGSSYGSPICMSKLQLQDHMNLDPLENPFFYNWNVVYVRYCDGTSYASNTVLYHWNSMLYFRGQQNRDDTIRALLSLGMNAATDIVISGCSAGALAVYLGIDQMASIIRTVNPKAIIRGLTISGYFLENEGINGHQASTGYHDINYPGFSYLNGMKAIFHLMNISAGVNPACLAHYAKSGNSNDTANCIFAGRVAPFLRTPSFSIQSKYDSWQLRYIVGMGYSNEIANYFGNLMIEDMMKTLHSSSQQSTIGHGSYIESCYHHCLFCNHMENAWNGQRIVADDTKGLLEEIPRKLSPAKAFVLWYTNHTLFLSKHHARTINDNSASRKTGRKHRMMSKSIPHDDQNGTTIDRALLSGTEKQQSLAIGQTRIYKKLGLFLQNEMYPCYHCCTCSIH